MEFLKCVVLGPPVSGKTSLINTFMSGQYQGYIPHNIITRYGVNFVKTGEEFSKNYYFKLFDYEIFKTNSQQFLKDDELDDIDVIILCFKNISSHRELIITQFKDILSKRWPNVPVLLVSSFSDLMEKFIWMNEPFDNELFSSQTFIKELGASNHIYCSSLENSNITEVFVKAFKLAIHKKDEISNEITIKNNGCNLEIHMEDLIVETVPNSNIKPTILQEKAFELNKLKESLDKKSSQTVSLSTFFIPISFGLMLLFYFLAHKYCRMNQRHCIEIYQLGMELYDESLIHLNDLYSLFHKFNINQ